MRRALSLLQPLRVLAPLPALMMVLGLMLLPVQPAERQGLEPPLALMAAEALAEALPRKPGTPSDPAIDPAGDGPNAALPASVPEARAVLATIGASEAPNKRPDTRDPAHTPRAPPALPV